MPLGVYIIIFNIQFSGLSYTLQTNLWLFWFSKIVINIKTLIKLKVVRPLSSLLSNPFKISAAESAEYRDGEESEMHRDGGEGEGADGG